MSKNLSNLYLKQIDTDKRKNKKIFELMQTNYIDKVSLLDNKKKYLKMYKKLNEKDDSEETKFKLNVTTKKRKLKYDNDLAKTEQNFLLFLKISFFILLVSLIFSIYYFKFIYKNIHFKY